MHPDTILRLEDIISGRSSAIEFRRFFVRNAAKFAIVGGACGIVPIAALLVQGSAVSAWSLLLPLGLALVLSFDKAREAIHFSRLVRQLEAAELDARAGRAVTVADIPALMRKNRPNNSLKRTDQSLRD
ncbi:MAG: hypothetical protein DDT39_01682 [Firmicutes bacterium]|nr:hypothetical protein [candidate division NPL-UPA2 bacterium]